MLVLSRKKNETIRIGDSIELIVLEVEGNSVKLGIEAPEEIRVLRGELWRAFQEQLEIARQLASGEEPASFEQLRQLLVDEGTEKEPQTDPESVSTG
jgi:carbon storage regulator